MDAPSPMLAYPAASWPTSGDWIMQPKWDGVRCLVGVGRGEGVRAWDRDGGDLTHRLGDLLEPFGGAAPHSVFDGELVALAGPEEAVQDFAGVRAAIRGDDSCPKGRLCFVVFDILSFDGDDVRERPLRLRDELLYKAVPPSARIRRVQSWPLALGIHRHLINGGFAGSILKRRTSLYRGGRQAGWRSHTAEQRAMARLVSVDRDGDGRAWAVCDREGQRVVAADAERLTGRPGDEVAIVYSRVDADGSLRCARVAD